MATLTNNSSGNFTTAATWSLIDSTSFNNTQAANTSTTTSFIGSTTFIPGAITIDGIGIQVSSRTAGGGTFSVRLANTGVAVPGTTVTINVSDMVLQPNGWVFCKFSVPVTLAGATAYSVQVQSSIASTVTVFRTGGSDWSRYLRTTTNQAPAAGDMLLVNGEFISPGVNNILTVTCDNTASTIFGQLVVSTKGIFEAATAASTAYIFTTDSDVRINSNAIIQLGTSGTPIPITSTFIFQINQGGINVNKGIILLVDGKFSTYGAAVTSKAFLNADALAAATTLTTDVSTGWLSGDKIAIASTNRTALESELKTMTANATGTSIPISALAFAHSGTGETKAELANLTRNVKIQSDSTSFGTYILTAGAAIFDCNYTEFSYMGSVTSNKRGIDILTTTGSFNVLGCSFYNFQASSFGMLANSTSNGNITIIDAVFYNMPSFAFSMNSGTNIVSTNTINGVLSINGAISLNFGAGAYSNITSVGTNISFATTAPISTATYTNLVVHSSSSAGFSFGNTTRNTQNFTNLTAWRNVTRGLFFSIASNISATNITTFGNGTSGIEISNSSEISLTNITANAGVTLTQPIGLSLTASSSQIFITDSSFGATTPHVTGDISVTTVRSWHDVILTNCLLASSTEIATQTNLAAHAVIGSTRHDQTNAISKMWKRAGTITSDSLINATSPLSQRITPNTAATKVISQNREFSIPTGKTAKVTVGIRRSVAGDGTAYNGALPRFWLRSNNSAGISTDILLATATSASLGAWEYISGIVPAANDNTVNSIYVDLDGTTGWVNFDVWKVEIINGSANGTSLNPEDYWQDGISFTGVNTLTFKTTGDESYWYGGTPATELFPISAATTGRMFLMFD